MKFIPLRLLRELFFGRSISCGRLPSLPIGNTRVVLTTTFQELLGNFDAVDLFRTKNNGKKYDAK